LYFTIRIDPEKLVRDMDPRKYYQCCGSLNCLLRFRFRFWLLKVRVPVPLVKKLRFLRFRFRFHNTEYYSTLLHMGVEWDIEKINLLYLLFQTAETEEVLAGWSDDGLHGDVNADATLQVGWDGVPDISEGR